MRRREGASNLWPTVRSRTMMWSIHGGAEDAFKRRIGRAFEKGRHMLMLSIRIPGIYQAQSNL
jgi:hypothetical protein